jgi:hypothetical protein
MKSGKAPKSGLYSGQLSYRSITQLRLLTQHQANAVPPISSSKPFTDVPGIVMYPAPDRVCALDNEIFLDLPELSPIDLQFPHTGP